MGLSPVFVTAISINDRPALISMSGIVAETRVCPGTFDPSSSASSPPAAARKTDASGTGKKLPSSASARSPSSNPIGSCTVRSFVPSGNVASTCTSLTMDATPGNT